MDNRIQPFKNHPKKLGPRYHEARWDVVGAEHKHENNEHTRLRNDHSYVREGQNLLVDSALAVILRRKDMVNVVFVNRVLHKEVHSPEKRDQRRHRAEYKHSTKYDLSKRRIIPHIKKP